MDDIPAALTGIGQVLGLLKQMADLAKSVGDTKNKAGLSELQEKLVEAHGKIASITATLTEQAAENLRLIKELHQAQDDLKKTEQEFEDVLKFNGMLKYEKNAYWTEAGDGPYCSGCWDGTRKTVRLAKKGDSHECPVCENTYIVTKDGYYPYREGTLNPNRRGPDED
jgi:hypothetical protein